ncbi:hypothetical protein B0O99DRAFT_695760 [Bisporella sp. PMI_857]|nr:hypothetical protein B0O99DRAFT_695760 [Bisporella sp. PMI_857]
MVSPLLSKGIQCVSCTRGMLLSADPLSLLVGNQIRGKKKLAKIATVNVQLLQNVAGYGRKGSIVPISKGVMRNQWYPEGIATYVTTPKLQELKRKNITAERDFEWGSVRVRKAALRSAVESQAVAPLEPPEDGASKDSFLVNSLNKENDKNKPALKQDNFALITSEQATTILSRLLPPSITFFRLPATAEATSIPVAAPRKISSSLSSSAVLSAAAERAAKEVATKTPAQLAGGRIGKTASSVTTNDVTANLKAILEQDEDGRRINLSPRNISFVEKVDGKIGVKQFGTFNINIRLDNSSEVVRRSIEVAVEG